MSLRLAASLTFFGLLVGCGPQQRYASSEATYLRFELVSAEHPESVSRWYECFALEDAEYRQLCLSRTPGVRVAQGPGLLCDDAPGPDLCRAFPLYAPDEYEESGGSTVDDDNAGAAIADAFGRLLVGILTAAFDSDDDDKPERDRARGPDDDDDDEPKHGSAGSERPRPEDGRRARQPENHQKLRR